MTSPGTAGPSGPTVARVLLEIGAVLMRPKDPFILTSGRASPVYVDCRKVIGFPRARSLITSYAVDAIWREIGVEALDVIAGGDLGHLSAEESKDVRSFLENPEAWSAAHGGKSPAGKE